MISSVASSSRRRFSAVAALGRRCWTTHVSYHPANGLAPTTTAFLFSDRRWIVIHTRDLNGDGRADLVWNNVETGETSVWLMNGTGIASAAYLSAAPGWSLQ